MSKHIQFTIADPCHENWDNMTQAEKGRFCASCQKQVIDFSNMSDSQLAVFFKKPSEENVCGRFFQDQLERDIEIPKKRIPWIKYFFHFALPAFLIPARATAQGKVKISKTDTIVLSQIVLLTHKKPLAMSLSPTLDPVQVSTALQGKVSGPVVVSTTTVADLSSSVRSIAQLIKGGEKIMGRVTDEKGEPIPAATVILKGTRTGTLANAAGEFTITQENQWSSIILLISSIGYETAEIKVMNDGTAQNIVLQTKLKSAEMGVIVCTWSSKKKRSKPIPLLTQQFMDTAFKFFKVFPNPASSGASLHIEWKKTEEGYYTLELLDLSGKKVYSKEIWIDAEARLLNLEVPAVTAGNYFLRATNKQSGKGFTEKIIIQ